MTEKHQRNIVIAIALVFFLIMGYVIATAEADRTTLHRQVSKQEGLMAAFRIVEANSRDCKTSLDLELQRVCERQLKNLEDIQAEFERNMIG